MSQPIEKSIIELSPLVFAIVFVSSVFLTEADMNAIFYLGVCISVIFAVASLFCAPKFLEESYGGTEAQSRWFILAAAAPLILWPVTYGLLWLLMDWLFSSSSIAAV